MDLQKLKRGYSTAQIEEDFNGIEILYVNKKHLDWLFEQAEKAKNWEVYAYHLNEENKDLKKEVNKQFNEFWQACVEMVGEDMAYEIVGTMPDDDQEGSD